MKTNSAAKYYTKFTRRNNQKSAIIWSIVLVIYAYSKIIGYAKGYPTYKSRLQFAALFSKTSGLSVLTGPANNIQDIRGYTVWAGYMFMMFVGIIWGILLITRLLRGDEQSEKLDLVLTEQLNLKILTRSIIRGINYSLLLFFVTLALLLVVMGKMSIINIAPLPMIFFALAITLAAWLFIQIGALTSQLFSTRKIASLIALSVFGVSLLIKAVADTGSSKWLLNFTPLGWFEKLSPLVNTNYLWLLPIILTGFVCYGLTIYFSGIRDVGESIIQTGTSTKSRLKSLSSIERMSFRFNKNLIIMWLGVILIINFVYGLLTKIAATAIAGSPGYSKAIDKLAASTSTPSIVATYAGAIFFINMIVICFFVVGCLSSLRKDEINSLDNNVLTGPTSRYRYLLSKLDVYATGLIVLAIGLSISFWIGTIRSGVHDLSLVTLMLAGINSIIPALLILAIGVLLFGIVPRISLSLLYVVLIVSILISLVGSDLSVNHFINDLSVFSHFKFAPAVSIDWKTNLIAITISAILIVIGLYRYNQRDLISD